MLKTLLAARDSFEESVKMAVKEGYYEPKTEADVMKATELRSSEELVVLLKMAPAKRVEALKKLSEQKTQIAFDDATTILVLTGLNAEQVKTVSELKRNDEDIKGDTIGASVKRVTELYNKTGELEESSRYYRDPKGYSSPRMLDAPSYQPFYPKKSR